MRGISRDVENEYLENANTDSTGGLRLESELNIEAGFRFLQVPVDSPSSFDFQHQDASDAMKLLSSYRLGSISSVVAGRCTGAPRSTCSNNSLELKNSGIPLSSDTATSSGRGITKSC